MIKEYPFNTVKEVRAFIEGVEVVNDPTMRIHDVVLEVGLTFVHSTVHINGKHVPVPSTRYVVLVLDEDVEDDVDVEESGWVRLNYGCTTQVMVPERK